MLISMSKMLKLLAVLPPVSKPLDSKAFIDAFTNRSSSQLIRGVKAPSGTFTEVPVVFASEPCRVKVLETWAGYYVMPTARHCKDQFERFLGIGAGNDGYRDDLCTFIPKYPF